jgi:hypothetical protein
LALGEVAQFAWFPSVIDYYALLGAKREKYRVRYPERLTSHGIQRNPIFMLLASRKKKLENNCVETLFRRRKCPTDCMLSLLVSRCSIPGFLGATWKMVDWELEELSSSGLVPN